MNLFRRFALVFFVLWITWLAGCEGKDPESESATVGGAIVGSNYTANGIQWFTVDGAGGDNLGAYTGGGGYSCCASYPRIWTPDLKVKVKWERSDGRDESGKQWRIKAVEKIISVDKYVEQGDIHVLFLPGDEVKVVISVVGVGSPNFPGRPGYPGNARPSKANP